MTARTYTLTAEEEQRIARIDQLVALGGDSADELIAAVSDPSWTVRRAAVAGLAALGDELVPSLCAWLGDRRTSERAIAAVVDALVASIGGTTNQAVIALLADPRAAVAADAANILGRRHALEATGALAARLNHLDDNVAVASIEALGALSPTNTPIEATEALIAVIEARGFFRTFPALQVLARTGDPRAVAPIAALLADPLYQTEAIRALGRTGSAFAIAPLAAAFTGASAEIVRTIAIALADLLARAEWSGAGAQVARGLQPILAPLLDQLVAATTGASTNERAAIAAVLGRAGSPSVLPVLVGFLDDDAVRPVAIAGIKSLGHEVALLVTGLEPEIKVALLPLVSSSRDTPHVRELLRDADPEIRARACEALARLGDTTSVPVLFEALGDPNPRVALAAAGAIQALQTTDTAPRVLACLASGSVAVKRQALRIVAYLGLGSAIAPVLALIDDPDRRVSELAIAALATIADPAAEPALDALATNPVPTTRAAAMRAWGHRGSARALPLLRAGLADTDAWVRYYAVQALGLLGDLSSVELLLARLEDEMPHVRIAAIEALARFDAPGAWTALVAAVHSKDLDECRAALAGLGQRPRAEAFPLLLEAASSTDLATRLIALSGLAQQPSSAALEELVRAANDPDPSVRDAALSLLAERDDADAIGALLAIALSTELDHPAHAALSRPSPARIVAIGEALHDATPATATILTAALARMMHPQANATLVDALAAASPAARSAAASSLIAMRAEGAVAAVTRLANEDPDADVRRLSRALVRGA